MIGPAAVYLVGVVTGSLIVPAVRRTVQGTIKAGLRIKRMADEAASELQGRLGEGSTPVKRNGSVQLSAQSNNGHPPTPG